MNDSVIDIFSLCRFFFKFGGNLTGRWYLHSPPSGKEGWLKAGVVGGYTMLIITDLRIHLPPPPTGTPPSRRRRMEIDLPLAWLYQGDSYLALTSSLL